MEKIESPSTLDEIGKLIEKYPVFKKIAKHITKRIKKIIESVDEGDTFFDSCLIEDPEIRKLAEDLPPGLEEKIIFVYQKLIRDIIEGNIT